MADPLKPYGPNNPHPLSVVHTELVWEGKYDDYGNRRAVDAAGLSMPLQRIETIDEPRARIEAQGEVFDAQRAHLDDFRNRLIWGDNRLVMASLLAEFKAKFDLIYIDPPFDVGADFTLNVPIGHEKEVIPKDQSALEMVAYRDTWGKGTDSYVHMMYERLTLMRELLSETGSLFVHCDYRVDALLRGVLDELFGRDNLVNEICWWYKRWSATSRTFQRMHDTILFYSRSDHYKFNQLFQPLAPSTEAVHGTTKRINVPDETGKLVTRRTDEASQGVQLHDVWEIPFVVAHSQEQVGFPTQKPVELMARVVDAVTDPGDLVGDFFCGSGSLLVAADGLRVRKDKASSIYYLGESRRWIGADLGRFAVHTTRKRMIDMQRRNHDEARPYRAFDIYNLGRYERQWWQRDRLAGADEEHRRVVLEFFQADVLTSSPSPLLHGRRGAAFCHVDGIDSIFTRQEAKAVAEALVTVGAHEVFCLSWEFEMDLRLECDRLEREHGIAIKLITIPREIMERNRKEPPPFLEVATLTAEPVFRAEDGRKVVDIKLTSFIPSLAEVPSKELASLKERTITSGFDFIDFWAVDFDYRNGGPFHQDWQDYRLRKDRSLQLESQQRHEYSAPGWYTACVKVVDIFGCDTSVSVKVEYA
jgi:DNA modification methylase